MATNRARARKSDEEDIRPLREADGPFSGLPPPNVLPARHPYNIVKRMSYISISLYGLHQMEVWHKIFHSPRVDHQWFKIGLAVSVALQLLKGYMEIYEGRVRKQKVDYKNYRHHTHALMILILLATIFFYMALSPEFGGGKTWLILLLFGFGINLQIMILVPTWIQNPVSVILMTFFIQQYK